MSRFKRFDAMCLIVFAYKSHPLYDLILAGNRDEFYRRPTAPLDFWSDHPRVLAGRDLECMGTWLGITREGRFAAVTNYREEARLAVNGPSRGQLVGKYLTGDSSPGQYMEDIAGKAQDYQGFNLLVGDAGRMFYFSNRSHEVRELSPGVYGLSNHLLGTPWPKVTRAVSSLKKVAAGSKEIDPCELLEFLKNRKPVPDEALPHTGVELSWERVLAPAFITSPDYGTRSSSILLIDRKGEVLFHEESWHPARSAPISAGGRRFKFHVAI